MPLFRSESMKKEWALLPWEGARLFLVSFLVLFFELLCIRWIPSYIRYLSYFSNFVLLSCFLGMSIGLLLARRRADFLSLFPPVLLLFIIIVTYVKFELKIETGDALFFKSTEVKEEQVEPYYLLPFVVGFVTVLFAFLSYEMGVLFDRFKPLTAYAWNIGGSMAGIAAFFLISLLQIPPVWWFIITGVGVLLLLRGSASQLLVSFVTLASTVYVAWKLQGESYWSPYYRITMTDLPDGGKALNVNNIGHQTMQVPEHKEGFYNVPYTSFKDSTFKRALIIGAGSGTDVSFAVKYGVESITGVEIDPVIYALGKKHHPALPYVLPRVKVHINDARTFVRNDRGTYDLIIYALPDSLTLTSSFANLRLESYLFTVESFRDTRARLAPGGLLVLYNYYREDWIIGRIAGMLREAFGYPPAVITYGGWGRAAVFMIGDKLKDLAHPVARNPGDPSLRLATDDWPFLYMHRPAVPAVFIKALVMLAVFGLLLVLVASPWGTLRRMSGHFFFLGAAFMLLETTSVVRFSLLFGSTWMVNSLVFFSVLAMVMLAIWVSHRTTIGWLWILYVMLFAVLALNYLLPLDRLLAGSAVLRFVGPSLLLFSPIFLANLIFAQTFKGEEGAAAVALASNTLGSLFGGMFEYSSLALGYRNLILFVAAFYALSFVFLNIAVLRKKRG
jgi:hypothetical protein